MEASRAHGRPATGGPSGGRPGRPDEVDAPLARVRRRLGPPVAGGLAIGPAADRLGSTPRMLRYRESVGLLGRRGRPGVHRRYRDRELLGAGYAAELESRYGVSPATLAFGLRAVSDAALAADLRRLAELVAAGPADPIPALDFESDKGRRLLRLG